MSRQPLRRRRVPRRSGGPVVDLMQARLERALAQRERYRYVTPRVEREGAGWKVVSPNCSRNVDPRGGDIDIAWLLPAEPGTWLLYARDHAARSWRPQATGVALDAALAQLCADPARVFWP